MCFVLKRISQRYIIMKNQCYKSDAFEVVIQLLVVTIKEIYLRTQAVCAKCLNVERWRIKCLAHRSKQVSSWKSTHALERHHFCGACCSWTSSADQLNLEQNSSATKCSWTFCHVTALIVFHYFRSVVTSTKALLKIKDV